MAPDFKAKNTLNLTSATVATIGRAYSPSSELSVLLQAPMLVLRGLLLRGHGEREGMEWEGRRVVPCNW